MNIQELNAFLHYGYIPNKSLMNFDSWLPYSIKKIEELQTKWQKLSLDEIIEHGSYQLQGIINGKPSRKNIVPLSGGLDSRAILGLLLQHYTSGNIKTVTCGIPGTWDFEIGLQIAKEFNLEATVVDLRSVEWNTEDLLKFAKKFISPIVITDAFMYSKILDNYKNSALYWIGFMGDPLAGSHLSNKKYSDWTKWREYFAQKERFTNRKDLILPKFNPLDFLPERPIVDTKIISEIEQLDFAIRQRQLIMPQVLPSEYNFQTPFLDSDWINFILSLPKKYRINQIAYKKILEYTLPDLFSMPTKNNTGLPLGASKGRKLMRLVKKRLKKYLYMFGFTDHCVNPNLNYVDFAKEFRSGSLKRVAQKNLTDLKKRNIVDWIDIDNIWKHHQERIQDLNKELALLLSLEINLKAGNF